MAVERSNHARALKVEITYLEQRTPIGLRRLEAGFPELREFHDAVAELLHGLDDQKLLWFWSAIHQFKYENKMPSRPFTRNERAAIRHLYEMALVLSRLIRAWLSPEVLLRMGDATREDVS